MGNSGDFVFTRDESGKLVYKGDFEGLYRAMDDPWGQSGEHPRMRDYYQFSRRRLAATVGSARCWTHVLEVGCGAGYVVNLLMSRFHRKLIHGCDVSDTAVQRARRLFPWWYFYHLDITDPLEAQTHSVRWLRGYYHVILLSQILWYVLDKLPDVFENCAKIMVPNGHLIIQTAFLDQQEYGRNIVDGWHGLIGWVLDHAPDWQIVSASYDASDRFAPYHDGVLVLRKGGDYGSKGTKP